jgi:hypothetical protein
MIIKAYERFSNNLLKTLPKRKAKGILGKSLHKTKAGRKFRMFWRLKAQRVTNPQTYWKTK